MTPQRDQPKKKAPKKAKVRTHTPRPDELSQETFEFIAAIDEYKREHMRSFLEDAEILEILFTLGYSLGDESAQVTEPQLDALAKARERYRVEQGRLFPTWSEIFELLTQLGYERSDRAA